MENTWESLLHCAHCRALDGQYIWEIQLTESKKYILQDLRNTIFGALRTLPGLGWWVEGGNSSMDNITLLASTIMPTCSCCLTWNKQNDLSTVWDEIQSFKKFYLDTHLSHVTAGVKRGRLLFFIFWKYIFWKYCILQKCIFWKCIFRKCISKVYFNQVYFFTRLACLLSFAIFFYMYKALEKCPIGVNLYHTISCANNGDIQVNSW